MGNSFKTAYSYQRQQQDKENHQQAQPSESIKASTITQVHQSTRPTSDVAMVDYESGDGVIEQGTPDSLQGSTPPNQPSFNELIEQQIQQHKNIMEKEGLV